jgi:hypothetical protein
VTKVRMPRALRGAALVLLFTVLLILPSLVRAAYFYRRPYVLSDVPQPDYVDVALPTMAAVTADMASAGERAPSTQGQVIIDRVHENKVDDAELNVLVSHLTARGLEIVSNGDPVNGLQSQAAWPGMLRAASALVVIAPHQPFTAPEIKEVERFVEQGGRVVLMGDPSRFALRPADVEDPLGDVLGDILVPESDVAALNSLASSFGLSFADDVLYNTVDNAGNYQYVILRDFAVSSLTAGLQEVVFYATHSILVDGETLIAADENTASLLSERQGGLATMSLGGEGRVLAVGDYTFMTEPYDTTANNGRLIANIADYVAGAVRTFGLSDFPSFFGDQTDLSYLADPADEAALPAEIIAQVARLRLAFEAVDKRLAWYGGLESSRAQPSTGRTPPTSQRSVGVGPDARGTLYLGLYAGLVSRPEVKQTLANRGITYTLETSEQALAQRLEGLDARSGQATRSQGQASSSTEETPMPTPLPAPTSTPMPLRDWIYVTGIGPVDAKQTSLFYQNEEGDRQTLIALAFDREGLVDVVERLLSGDYADCLLDEDRGGDPQRISLALCPSAYQPQGESSLPVPAPEAPVEGTPVPAVEGGILVVSDDDGEGVYEWWTSAYDFADIATQAGYVVTLWSTSVEGELDLARMQSFDAVIWCTGDYQKEGGVPDEDDLSTMLAYLDGGGRLILGGAFLGPEGEGERGLLLDVQVTQAGHPLAEGFEAGQVITLERFTADEDYATTVLSETNTQAIVFSRGPTSELSGRAAITVEENPTAGSKTVWIGFPLFLLPTEARFRMATNAIRWILE